uniref:Uncharacterized protein n=1 Tax=Strigamia maritima TaxID=126957 RepID=T1JBN8_STRMM
MKSVTSRFALSRTRFNYETQDYGRRILSKITRPMELELELNLNPSTLKKTKLHSPVNFKWPNSPAVEKTPSTNSTSAVNT